MNLRSQPGLSKDENLPIRRVRFSTGLRRAGAAVLLVCGFFAVAVTADESGHPGGASVQEAPVSPPGNPMFEALGKLHDRQRWLEGEVGRLQEQLAESASGFVAIQQALRDKESEVSRLRGQVVELERSNREGEEARRRESTEKERLAAALAAQCPTPGAGAPDLQSRLTALQKRLSDMELEEDEQRVRCTELEQGRDQALSANLIMQAEKRELEGELERQSRVRDELTRRIETLEVTLKARGVGFEAMAEEKGELEEALARSERRESSQPDLQPRLAELEKAAKAAEERAAAAEAELVRMSEAGVARENGTEALPVPLRESMDAKGEIEPQPLTPSAQLRAAEGAKGPPALENVKLRASLVKARQEAADAVQRLKVLEETHAGAVAALERMQQEKAELEAKAVPRAVSSSQEKCPKEQAIELAPQDSSAGRIEECEGKLVELEALNKQLTQEAGSLRSELESLRALLPASSGGSADQEAPE